MSKPDVARLRKYVEWVEEQELLDHRSWVQSTWVLHSFVDLYEDGFVKSLEKIQFEDCGTAFCVAGKVAHDDGFIMDPHGTLVGLTKDADPQLKKWVDQGTHCAAYAADALGLTEDQALDLFSGSNTAHSIRRIAERAAGERL